MIRAQWLEKTKKKMTDMMADMTGQSREKVAQDIERDYFMDAEEAKAYGIIDEIFEPRDKAKETGDAQ
jgi:ATP-dependent Clp protease protease subunit